MKKVVAFLTVVLVLVAAILFVHPVKVLSDDTSRYIVCISHVPLEIEGVADRMGGYQCYINDSEYIWVSYDAVEMEHKFPPMTITFKFPWQTPVINTGSGGN